MIKVEDQTRVTQSTNMYKAFNKLSGFLFNKSAHGKASYNANIKKVKWIQKKDIGSAWIKVICCDEAKETRFSKGKCHGAKKFQ